MKHCLPERAFTRFYSRLLFSETTTRLSVHRAGCVASRPHIGTHPTSVNAASGNLKRNLNKEQPLAQAGCLETVVYKHQARLRNRLGKSLKPVMPEIHSGTPRLTIPYRSLTTWSHEHNGGLYQYGFRLDGYSLIPATSSARHARPDRRCNQVRPVAHGEEGQGIGCRARFGRSRVNSRIPLHRF